MCFYVALIEDGRCQHMAVVNNWGVVADAFKQVVLVYEYCVVQWVLNVLFV